MNAPVRIDDERMLGGIADVGELYERRAGQVRRLVRHEVRAPEPVIEDACQVAWIRLVGHRERVHRDTAVAWLVRTAMHEALKLIRRANRELPLEVLVDQTWAPCDAVLAPSPEEILEPVWRLQLLRSLSDRQRRLVWLQALGWSYAEMADQTGITPRTVERQLIRARHKLALADADADV